MNLRIRRGLLLGSPTYTPNRLLNYIEDLLDAQHDSVLSRKTGMNQNSISAFRGKKLLVSGNQILMIHDATGLSVDKIRELCGIPFKKGPQDEE